MTRTGVISVIKAQGQYQVVVGNNVIDMFNSINNILEKNQNDVESKFIISNQKKSNFKIIQTFINELVGVITGSMVPIIGILAGAGIVKGLLAATVTLGGITDSSQIYLILSTISDSVFHFLPVILGFTSAQKLRSNPIVIAIVGGILINPTIIDIASSKSPYITILGLDFPIMNYAASVFPILVAAFLGKYIEQLLKKIIPKVVSSILSPILEIIILSFLILLIVGPIITLISNELAQGIIKIFDFNTIFGGAIYCALFPILVVFGMHWPLIPIIVNDLTVNGFSMMNAFSSVLMMGIAGATLSVALKTKKQNLKQLAFAATISQLCGVGEPAIYGILLKFKKVFYVVTISNFIGGGIAGALHLVNYGFAGGLIGFAAFINPKEGIDQNFYSYLISHIGTFLLSFLLTWFFGYNDSMKTQKELKEL